MANSRRSASSVAEVPAAILRALGGLPGDARVAVAFSGGLDSTVLLHALTQVRPRGSVIALHVHHGLQAAADSWPAHCAAQAQAWGAAFEVLRLQDAPTAGDSVEQWARDARYRALAPAAGRCGAAVLMTAHHADDQVETLLMRLARGTGPDGLAGIEPVVGFDEMTVLRPLLDLPRSRLHAYALAHDLAWIDDPSNTDRRFVRNALRHDVLPAFEAAVPGLRSNLLRAAAHWRAARDVLREVAAADLRAIRLPGSDLQVADRVALAGLPPARRALALREWLSALGSAAPSAGKLREMQSQLIEGRSAYGCVTHADLTLLRYRDRIVALPRGDSWQQATGALRDLPPSILVWRGEPRLPLAAGLGSLRFDAAANTASGVSSSWLHGLPLSISPGSASGGGLRMRPDGPLRTLKNLYQEQGIPAWLRPALPLIKAGERPLYAAGLGLDQSRDWPRAMPAIAIAWEPDAGPGGQPGLSALLAGLFTGGPHV